MSSGDPLQTYDFVEMDHDPGESLKKEKFSMLKKDRKHRSPYTVIKLIFLTGLINLSKWKTIYFLKSVYNILQKSLQSSHWNLPSLITLLLFLLKRPESHCTKKLKTKCLLSWQRASKGLMWWTHLLPRWEYLWQFADAWGYHTPEHFVHSVSDKWINKAYESTHLN